MSMFIVSENHITALVHGLTRRELVSGQSPSEIGRVLWGMNLLACFDRYPNTQTGVWPIDFTVHTPATYRYIPPAEPVSPQALAGGLECYVYQCDEAKTWKGSQAEQWCALLEASLEREGIVSGLNDWSL